MPEAPCIDDYALIGDCHTAALVSGEGAIDWCCLPASTAATASDGLLGEAGGTCIVTVNAEDGSQRRDDLDGTLVLSTMLRSASGEARLLDCLAIPDDESRRWHERLLLRVAEGIRGAVPLGCWSSRGSTTARPGPGSGNHGSGTYTALGGNDGLRCWSDAALTPAGDHALEASVSVRAGEGLRLALPYRRPEELDGNVRPLEPEAGNGIVRLGNAATRQLQLDAYGHLLEQSWRWYERRNAPDDDYWRASSSTSSTPPPSAGMPGPRAVGVARRTSSFRLLERPVLAGPAPRARARRALRAQGA